MHPIRVGIVEDNRFFRDTVVELLDQQDGMECTLAVGSVEEVRAELQNAPPPDVVLMDIELPGASGLEGIALLIALSPTINVIVLTVHQDEDKIFRALCAGACGYLVKPASAGRIIDAVETAARGGAPMNALIARKVLTMFMRAARPGSSYGLTEREREILQLLVAANSQKQIARLLDLSPHTVDSHLRHIYAKLHVNSRAGAVAKALQERLL
jgi:DNA-binding NarL/FixJ family response regulator